MDKMDDAREILDGLLGWEGCWDAPDDECHTALARDCDWPIRQAKRISDHMPLCPCACHPDGVDYVSPRPFSGNISRGN